MAQILGTDNSSAALNAKLCALAQSQAKIAWAAVEFAKYVDNQGPAGLQQAGFDTTGATNFQAAADYMKTVGQVFLGQATQGNAFDFSNALAAFIGPDPQAELGG